MAFQFQFVASLAPLITEQYSAGLADIGLLIGLYLAPGAVIAIPGGATAARFGERRVVCLGMILMLLGGALFGFGAGWGSVVAGRVIAGVGGVIINVVMTKLLADWFVGREISTAMSIFVNSWPVGIAASLLILPYVATHGGLALASVLTLSLIALALLLFFLVYRVPARTANPTTRMKSGKLPLVALFMAASVWALFNSAYALVISFGPILLSERGWSLTAAGSATSAFLVFTAISAPLGGMLADYTGRRDLIMVTSLLGFSMLMIAALITPLWAAPLIFVIMGFVCGFAVGPMVGMPSLILPPEIRALGMGVYYAVYYAAMMVVPGFAGWMADIVGNVGVAFVLGSVMLGVCIVPIGLFRRVSVRSAVVA